MVDTTAAGVPSQGSPELSDGLRKPRTTSPTGRPRGIRNGTSALGKGRGSNIPLDHPFPYTGNPIFLEKSGPEQMAHM